METKGQNLQGPVPFKIRLSNMINIAYRYKLAKLLKLMKEVNTDNGVLVAEAETIEVGTEVFIDGKDGLIPAPDQEYVDLVENKIYTVEGGTISEIREKVTELVPEQTEENLEEKESGNGTDTNNEANETGNSAEVENPAENGEDSGNGEDKVAELESALEAANAKIAELEATVSDLEDQVAAYKAKEEETAPSAEEAEKFSAQNTGDKNLDKKMKAAKAIANIRK